jgi:hypothetical protein
VREIFPTNLCKPVLFLGLFTWLASEAMMPMFSFLSRLIFEGSTSAYIVSTINFLGSVILSIPALNGLVNASSWKPQATPGCCGTILSTSWISYRIRCQLHINEEYKYN